MSLSTNRELLAGRYRLDGLLGTGGMGEVHRAWDTRLHRHVAVKLFRSSLDPTAARRFDSEIQTLAALSHPGLVSVYDAGIGESTPFMVLQLVDGHTLHHRIGDSPLTPDEVRSLGVRLAEALAYVHAHNVVHRDIKPSNILLDEEDNAYLADFGLAQLAGATRLTSTGELVGTAAYLAPEQVKGDGLGYPLDVYALGLVLLECLTARREYEGSEVEAAVARLHRQPEIPPDLPADLVKLLTRMTSLAPRRRPTALQCARILREAGGGRTPARDTRVRKGILVATVAVALGLAGGAWAMTSGQNRTTSGPTSDPGSTSSEPSSGSSGNASSEPVPANSATTPGDLNPGNSTRGNSTGDNAAPGTEPAVSGSVVPTTNVSASVVPVEDETTKVNKGREKSAENSPTKKNGG